MITIVDAPCGAGKTQWALAHMNAHPEGAFVFVTPFLSEVERIKQGTTAEFYDPQYYQRTELLGGNTGSKTKLADFNDLLTSGKNVVTTHVTFTSATAETINILRDNAYTLIVDEAVDVLIPLNDVVESPRYCIKKTDAKLMLSNHIITVGDDCRVHWTGGCLPVDGEDRHAYSEVQRYAENGTLLLIDNQFFLWELPPELFSATDSTIILTYRIEGSFLYPYLNAHNIPMQKMSVCGTYKDGFELAPYKADMEQREAWKKLITLYIDKHTDGYGPLSATWYTNKVQGHPRSPEAVRLKNGLRRFLRNVKATPGDTMWSCPKRCRDDISPRGYKLIRELTDVEKRNRTHRDLEKYVDDNGLRCWIASNARATNNYSNRHVLAYVLNLNPNPEIGKYFNKRGTSISSDEFALAGLIQWVWRSAIRRGEPITLWLPSPRMYALFTEWLDGKR